MQLALRRNWLYRATALLGIVAAVALVLTVPDRFKEPDDWAYRYAAENLSHGRLTVDTALHQQQAREAEQQGGTLGQYVQVGPDRWAFEKTPGYVYFLIPFYLLGVPQLANILLAAGLALVTYLLLKELRGERAACLGVLLVLFTPVALAMLQREFMDGFASLAMPGMGGGLYLLYQLRRGDPKRARGALLLLVAGLLLGWGIAARYTNAVIAGVFALHFLTTRVPAFLKGERRRVLGEAAYFGLGVAVPVGLLLIYQQQVFGSPFAYGYEYTRGNVKFAYDYLGTARAWQTIAANLRRMWGPLLAGFPVLLLALPGAGLLLWEQAVRVVPALRRRARPPSWPRLTPDLALLLLGWAAAVFGLYLMYEWTANQRAEVPFIVVTRFYLPALPPLSVLAVLTLSRLPGKLALSLLAVAVVAGGLLFAQSSQSVLGPGRAPQPPPQGAPLPQEEAARLIEQVRREVRRTPTDASNMRRRLDALMMWIEQLGRSGAYAGRLPPPPEVQRLQALVAQNRAAEAGPLIDQMFQRLERLTAP